MQPLSTLMTECRQYIIACMRQYRPEVARGWYNLNPCQFSYVEYKCIHCTEGHSSLMYELTTELTMLDRGVHFQRLVFSNKGLDVDN